MQPFNNNNNNNNNNNMWYSANNLHAAVLSFPNFSSHSFPPLRLE